MIHYDCATLLDQACNINTHHRYKHTVIESDAGLGDRLCCVTTCVRLQTHRFSQAAVTTNLRPSSHTAISHTTNAALHATKQASTQTALKVCLHAL